MFLICRYKCKKFNNEVELPKANFGPSAMCSHCGSLWNTVDHQVRISRGRKMSKSVKKIIRYMNEFPNQKVPKVRATLVKKAIQNEMNKLVIKCSICSKNTVLPFKKTSRLKPIVETNKSQTETVQNNQKKKKKKSKDKTAGLNLSGYIPESPLSRKDNNKTSSSPVVATPKINKMLPTSNTKTRKFNIERLRALIEKREKQKDHITTNSKKSLHNFLIEL